MTTDRNTQNMHFFRNDEGRITIWQWPNIPLCGWLIFKIFPMIVDNSQLKASLNDISKAFLFTWAFLEITQGVNYFRRLLGLVVFMALVLGFFKH